MVELDELDVMHASLPELEPASWMSHEDDGGTAIVIATVMCEDDSEVDVAEERAKDAVTLLRAYPALAAELKGTRKMEAEALLALAKVADLISENGCDCECGHHYEEHDDDCERCFACRVEECFTRPIRDAIHEVPR